MSFFSAKMVLIFILLLAILVFSSFIFFSKPQKPTPTPLPVQQMSSTAPSPTISTYQKPSVQPLPSFSPPSEPYEQLTQQQKEQVQAQADEYYQKVQDTILKKYPWYLDMPIQDSYYFVYFDPDSETFIATLYPQKTFSASLDEQVADLKKVVVEKINALGSGAEKYKIDWRITPE